MKKTVTTLATALLLVVIYSCDDFLDKAPQGLTTQETFPTTADDALLAVNASYSSLRNWSYHSGGYPILDIMSDDAYKGSNPTDQSATIGSFDTFEHTADLGVLDNWWNALYEGIKRTNVVIEFVPRIEMDETLKARYLGEAHFLRALYYFDLVRAWGGVQIVETTSPPQNLQRSSAEEVYDLIESDLLLAIDQLVEKSDLSSANQGRATKGAAKALLAKVYLFDQDFELAEDYALEVINSNQYDLETDYHMANSVDGENGMESIFEVGALEIANTDGGGNQYANTQGVRGVPNKGWGFNRPSIDLRDSYEAGDPREDASIIDLGETIDGITIQGDTDTPDLYDNGYAQETESYNQKVWVPGTNTISNFGHNRRILRYADVLLMAAEALNENDKPTEAHTYLNEVRARARQGNAALLPDINETDKEQLRDIILHERRSELALEGHRFWDLVRTGKAEETLGSRGYEAGKHELLPIPQNQIDLAQGDLQQNLNW